VLTSFNSKVIIENVVLSHTIIAFDVISGERNLNLTREEQPGHEHYAETKLELWTGGRVLFPDTDTS